MFNVFTAYAHADEDLRDELETHLAMLKRAGRIAIFHDRKILPGQDWAAILDERLLSADIVVLLVSPHFLASDYCFGVEMATALDLQRQGLAIVVPVIVRPSDWNHPPLAALQAVPTDARPITVWPNRDEAFLDVVVRIRTLLDALPPKAIPIELALEWSPSAMVAARSNRMMFGPAGRVPSSVALLVPDQGVLVLSYVVLAVVTDSQGRGVAGSPVQFSVRGGTFGGLVGQPNPPPDQLFTTITDDKGSAMAKIYPHEREVWVEAVVAGYDPVSARTLCAPQSGG